MFLPLSLLPALCCSTQCVFVLSEYWCCSLTSHFIPAYSCLTFCSGSFLQILHIASFDFLLTLGVTNDQIVLLTFGVVRVADT